METPVTYEVTLPPTLVVAVDDLRFARALARINTVGSSFAQAARLIQHRFCSHRPALRVTHCIRSSATSRSKSKASRKESVPQSRCIRSTPARRRSRTSTTGISALRSLTNDEGVRLRHGRTRSTGRSRALLGALGASRSRSWRARARNRTLRAGRQALGKALVVIEDEDTAQHNAPLAISS